MANLSSFSIKKHMDNFETNFEKAAKRLEKLSKEWKIEGIPKGHENIWVPKNEVKLWSIKRRTDSLGGKQV